MKLQDAKHILTTSEPREYLHCILHAMMDRVEMDAARSGIDIEIGDVDAAENSYTIFFELPRNGSPLSYASGFLCVYYDDNRMTIDGSGFGEHEISEETINSFMRFYTPEFDAEADAEHAAELFLGETYD